MLLFCVFFVNLHFETNDIRNHRSIRRLVTDESVCSHS